MKKILWIALGIFIVNQLSWSQAQWQSSIVHFGPDGKLAYVADSEGNRIPDFSYAGYKNGGVAFPNVEVVRTIGPVAGDNTQNIQSAIDYVAGLPLDAKGVRGAVLLNAGVYKVGAPIHVNATGVVLRGVGEGNDSSQNTILSATGDSATQHAVIIAGGGNETQWSDSIPGTTQNIVSDSVPVGERTFQVSDASPYSVGDNIIVYHPCSLPWLQAIDFGGTDTAAKWTEGYLPIFFNRYITAKNGNTITIDAPVFNALVRKQSQSFIYKYARSGLQTKIGIENLRIDIFTTDITTNRAGNENHAVDAVDFTQVEDAWARHCTVLHFVQSGFKMSTATRVTVDSCTALDPISIMDGTRRYNFNLFHAAQLVLYSHCFSNNARHDFVSNGESAVSGDVFLDNLSDSAYDISEGHRHWSQGLLYDNISFLQTQRNTTLGAYNRGSSGTSHGWAAVNSVLWNCNAGVSSSGVARIVLVQKPPTAQNYSIGCFGNVTGAFPIAPFNQPQGYIEGANKSGLNPRSLYLAQLKDRLPDATGIILPPRQTSSDNIAPGLIYSGNEIKFWIPPNPVTENGTRRVVLKMFDPSGKEGKILLDASIRPGWYQENLKELRLARGVYWCRLRVDESKPIKKMVVVE